MHLSPVAHRAGMSAIFVLGLILALGQARAQDKPAAPNSPDPAHLAAAIELMKLTKVEQRMKQMMPMMLTQQMNAMRALRKDIRKETFDELGRILAKKFNDRTSEIVEASARLYIRHFSESELRELIAFYRTDIGRKTITSMPLLVRELFQYGTRWGQQIGREAAEEARRVLKEKGL